MKHEFNILYRETLHPCTAEQVPNGPVLAVNGIADGADQLQNAFEAAGLDVVAITEVRAVVDWSKPNFNREETAAYLGIKPDTISKNKGDGNIPWVELGYGLVPRVWLEKYVRDHANPAGEKMAQELESFFSGFKARSPQTNSV